MRSALANVERHAGRRVLRGRGAVHRRWSARCLSFPLFRLRGDYFAFATLALLPLFELLASTISSCITRGSDGILLPPATAMIYGIDVKMYAYYVALAARSPCSC